MPLGISAPIVVVDDSEDDIFVLKHLLKKTAAGFSVVTFDNGDAAIESLSHMADDELPHLILLDVKMPGASGFDVLKAIRRCRLYDTVPVAMLSSSDDRTDIARSAKLGADCYLLKHPSVAQMKEFLHDAAAFSGDSREPVFAAPYNTMHRRD
jgi:two-component system, response regulator